MSVEENPGIREQVTVNAAPDLVQRMVVRMDATLIGHTKKPQRLKVDICLGIFFDIFIEFLFAFHFITYCCYILMFYLVNRCSRSISSAWPNCLYTCKRMS